jgi:hypothetical protein
MGFGAKEDKTMRFRKNTKVVIGYIWRVPLCAFAYMAGAMASAGLVSKIGMKLPPVPEQANEQTMGLCLLIGCFVLAIGIGQLARRIRARYWVRCLILATLTYVCIGLNTPIEAAIFTNIGGMRTMVIFSLLPWPSGKAEPFGRQVSHFFSGGSVQKWAWRLAAAVCAFPVIYWTFGMMVAPWVIEYYKQGQFGLTLPGTGIIILTQLLRSSLFFLAALPILIVWPGSRRQLTVQLGFAFFVLVGLFGMIQTYWLGPVLLVLHTVEILVDSMVYAGVLSLLFVRKEPSELAATSNFVMA